MVEIAPGWTADVDRGPDWLFVKLRNSDDASEGTPLADTLWEMLREHFVCRMVLELDEVDLHRELVGELRSLQERIDDHGGLLRLCGVSDESQEVLRADRLESRFAQFRNREEAVFGHRPQHPR